MNIGIDVGAWEGDTINKFYGFDKVFCIEPHKKAYEILKNNTKNDPRIQCFNFAVSTKDGQSKFNSNKVVGMSSLLELDKDGEFSQYLNNIDPKWMEVEDTYEIDTLRLDTFLEKNNIDTVKFLKIDTQGHDFEVVKSLGKRIKDIEIIELEIQLKKLYHNQSNYEETIQYMNDHKFFVFHEESTGSDKQSFEKNLFFKKQ